MKINIESAFNEQGIPIDPNVTNEYYNWDFDSDTSPEPRSASRAPNSINRTIGPQIRQKSGHRPHLNSNNLAVSKTFSSYQSKGSNPARIEYQKLIDIKNNVIDANSKTESKNKDQVFFP